MSHTHKHPCTMQQEQFSSMLLWFGVKEWEEEFVQSLPTFRKHFSCVGLTVCAASLTRTSQVMFNTIKAYALRYC